MPGSGRRFLIFFNSVWVSVVCHFGWLYGFQCIYCHLWCMGPNYTIKLVIWHTHSKFWLARLIYFLNLYVPRKWRICIQLLRTRCIIGFVNHIHGHRRIAEFTWSSYTLQISIRFHSGLRLLKPKNFRLDLLNGFDWWFFLIESFLVLHLIRYFLLSIIEGYCLISIFEVPGS